MLNKIEKVVEDSRLKNKVGVGTPVHQYAPQEESIESLRIKFAYANTQILSLTTERNVLTARVRELEEGLRHIRDNELDYPFPNMDYADAVVMRASVLLTPTAPANEEYDHGQDLPVGGVKLPESLRKPASEAKPVCKECDDTGVAVRNCQAVPCTCTPTEGGTR